MKTVYILMDVGGTQIKGSVFDENGNMLKEIQSFPAKARESKETVLENFCSVIRTLAGPYQSSKLAGIGMAFPGPFDYENGISLMKKLDKYDTIYGVSIREAVKERERLAADAEMIFLHDVEAFAIGSCRMGKAAGKKKVLCLCIGTGAGSAFMEDGIPQKAAVWPVPENGWIYNTPFRDSCIDDYLSVRGLDRLSRKILGRSADGKELFELCGQKDERALQVYREFGEDLNECMTPFLQSFCPDALVLGGQIAKSFAYYGQKLRDTCKNLDIQIIIEENTSFRAMQGLYINCKAAASASEDKTDIRGKREGGMGNVT